MHRKWKGIIDTVCKQPMENCRGPTPDEKSHLASG